MTLVVRVPPGRRVEREYVLGVVLGDRLGLAWRLAVEDRADVRIEADGEPGGRAVLLPDGLLGTPDRDWLGTASIPRLPLSAVPVGPHAVGPWRADERLSRLYGGDGAPPAALLTPDEVGARLHVDVLGGVFFLITRYEEAAAAERDGYDRFPAAAAVAARAGFLGMPLADAYVELLWAALRLAWPRLQRPTGSYGLLLTHDVDDPLATLGRTATATARQFAADLVHRRDPGLAVRRARAVVAARRGDHDPDVHNTFRFLMDVSERNGLRSAFYFQAHRDPDPAAGAQYALGHPWIRQLVGEVHDRGHEVGYHAGFGTYRDPARTSAEFALLRETAERLGVRQDRWGGRQHYLQWANPQTWRNWEVAGLTYDCTLAFADAVGFRTGTCHEYRVFDLLARRPLRLHERPFQVMDVTLFGYQALAPEAAIDAVMRLAAQCRRFGGRLGILWHNDAHLRTAHEKRWYAALVEAAAAA